MARQLTMTEEFAALGKEKLGMMLTVWDELGWWEKNQQAPILAGEPGALCSWLLAGTDSAGFAPEGKNRRALARGQWWVDRSDWAPDLESAKWTAGAALMSVARFANPFSRPFAASSGDGLFEEAAAGGLSLVAGIGALIPGALMVAAGAPVGAIWGCALGAFYASRAAFAFGGKDRRRRYLMRSATAPFAKMRALALAKIEVLKEDLRLGRKEVETADSMREALRRASLDMEPAQEEREKAQRRQLESDALERGRALALEKAKNALAVESAGERRQLEGLVSSADGEAPPPRRKSWI